VQVDALSVELRPRSMTEASDLGIRMVQANAASVWRSFVPVYAVVVALALSTVDVAPWLPATAIFWLKPWLDRSVLFALSRAVFGQSTTWIDLWRAARPVWCSRLAVTLSLRRLSPWRSYTLPIEQLEGQLGAALRARRRTILGGQHAELAHRRLADVQGLAAIRGKGLELVCTLGTGFGTAWFRDGVLLPHMDLAHLAMHSKDDFDVIVGDTTRREIGTRRWNNRIRKLIAVLETVFSFDHLYLGGGNSACIDFRLPRNVTIVSNDAGMEGGAFAWKHLPKK